MREDPPPDARCRDKFLVQSVAITPERDMGNVTAIVSQTSHMSRHMLTIQQWQNVEKISKSSIEERKIRVIFLPADGTVSTPQHNNVNGTVRTGTTWYFSRKYLIYHSISAMMPLQPTAPRLLHMALQLQKRLLQTPVLEIPLLHILPTTARALLSLPATRQHRRNLLSVLQLPMWLMRYQRLAMTCERNLLKRKLLLRG